MFCKHCAKATPDDAAFCPFCGSRILRDPMSEKPGEPVCAASADSFATTVITNAPQNTRVPPDDTVESHQEASSILLKLDDLILDTDGAADTFAPGDNSFVPPANAPAAVRGVYKPSLAVSAAGDGDYRTIGEALEHAQPDACISVRPGHYVEALVVGKPVELVSEGQPGSVVLESVGEQAILMWAPRAVIRGLTIRASSSGETAPCAVKVPRGRLELDGCDISAPGLICVAAHGNSAEVLLHGCTIHEAVSGVFVYDGASATLDECSIVGTELAAIGVSRGGKADVARCTIDNNRAAGIHFQDGGGTVTMCEVCRNSAAGIAVTGAGSRPEIRRCTIHHGEGQGVLFSEGATGEVSDCEIFGNTLGGIEIRAGADPAVRGCIIRDNPHTGIQVTQGGKGRIDDCDVARNNLAGIAVREEASTAVHRCRIHHGKASGVYVFGGGRGMLTECDVFENALENVRVCEKSEASVRGCIIRHGASDGVLVATGARGVFEDCTVADNARAGIVVREKADPVIRSCTIRGNRHEAIRIYESASALVERCALTGNHRSSWSIAPGCSLQRKENTEDDGESS